MAVAVLGICKSMLVNTPYIHICKTQTILQMNFSNEHILDIFRYKRHISNFLLSSIQTQPGISSVENSFIIVQTRINIFTNNQITVRFRKERFDGHYDLLVLKNALK